MRCGAVFTNNPGGGAMVTCGSGSGATGWRTMGAGSTGLTTGAGFSTGAGIGAATTAGACCCACCCGCGCCTGTAGSTGAGSGGGGSAMGCVGFCVVVEDSGSLAKASGPIMSVRGCSGSVTVSARSAIKSVSKLRGFAGGAFGVARFASDAITTTITPTATPPIIHHNPRPVKGSSSPFSS